MINKKYIFFVFILNINIFLHSQDQKLKIGTTGDIDSKVEPLAKNIIQGLKTCINKNKKINLTIYDDEFNPDKARKNIEKFMENGINIILSPIGSYPFKGFLDYVKTGSIAAIFPNVGAPEYRNANLKGIVHFISSSSDEAKILFNYLIKDKKIKKFAIFYINEPYSLGALKEARIILVKNGLTKAPETETDNQNFNWIEIEQENVKTIDTKNIAEKIKKFDPQAIILLALTSKLEALLNSLTKDYYSTKILATISASPNLRDLLGQDYENFIMTTSVPDLNDPNSKIIKEYKKDMQELGMTFDRNALEGYISAMLFINICQKIEWPITKEKLLKYIENIKDYDFYDFKLNFDPKKRELANYVWLYAGKNNFRKYNIKIDGEIEDLTETNKD